MIVGEYLKKYLKFYFCLELAIALKNTCFGSFGRGVVWFGEAYPAEPEPDT